MGGHPWSWGRAGPQHWEKWNLDWGGRSCAVQGCEIQRGLDFHGNSESFPCSFSCFPRAEQPHPCFFSPKFPLAPVPPSGSGSSLSSSLGSSMVWTKSSPLPCHSAIPYSQIMEQTEGLRAFLPSPLSCRLQVNPGKKPHPPVVGKKRIFRSWIGE